MQGLARRSGWSFFLLVRRSQRPTFQAFASVQEIGKRSGLISFVVCDEVVQETETLLVEFNLPAGHGMRVTWAKPPQKGA